MHTALLMSDVEVAAVPLASKPPSRRVTIKDNALDSETDEEEEEDVEKVPQKESKTLERKSSVVLKKYGMV